MKKTIILLFGVILATLSARPQQIPLKGVVTVQNSKTRTGHIQYVPNAQVEHPKAKPEASDSEGRFTLFVTGVKSGAQTAITVTPTGAYREYVVVNEHEIQNITLGRILPVDIYVCPRGELEQRKADMIGINMRRYEARVENDRKRLMDELQSLKDRNDYLNARYAEIGDSLKLLAENTDAMFERITDYAEKFVVENLDLRDDNYVKAYMCFSRGELDSVSFYIMEDDLDSRESDLRKMEEDIRKMKEQVSILRESAGIKETYAAESIEQLLKEWILLERATERTTGSETAALYEKIIRVDTLNRQDALALAASLINDGEYAKAEKYCRMLLLLPEPLTEDDPKANNPEWARVLYNIGNNYYAQQMYAQAGEYFSRCLAIYEQLTEEYPEEYRPQLYLLLNELGIKYLLIENYPQAIVYSLKCIEICEQIDDNKSLASYLEGLSSVYLLTGEYALSEQAAQKALKTDSSLREAKKNLAHALLFQNRFAEAEVMYKELIRRNAEFIRLIKNDFDALEEANAVPEERKADVETIRKLLNEKQ